MSETTTTPLSATAEAATVHEAVQTAVEAALTNKASMGLKGIWAQIANVSAVAFACVLCYVVVQAQLSTAKEDREVYRESLTRAYDYSAKQDAIHREDLQRQWSTIDAQRSATLELTTAVRALSDEVRQLKKEKP